MNACPPLEDIAAFIDGMLSPEERERVTAHLARCASCYEVFAGAVEFQEDEFQEEDPPATGTEGRGVSIVPLAEKTKSEAAKMAPPPQARRKSLWLPLAASVVLTAGVGFFAWQALRPPEITVDSVAATFKKRPAVAGYAGAAMRGGEEPSHTFERPDFMAGVYLLDLRLFGTTALDDLKEKLSKVYGWQDPGPDNGQPDLGKLEREVEDTLKGSSAFSFGLWAEGGRLAAATRSPGFFEDRNNRRFLSRLLKERPLPVPAELEESILGYLTRIESLWEKDDLSKQDFQALATQFGRIINTIDNYEDDFSDPLEPE